MSSASTPSPPTTSPVLVRLFLLLSLSHSLTRLLKQPTSPGSPPPRRPLRTRPSSLSRPSRASSPTPLRTSALTTLPRRDSPTSARVWQASGLAREFASTFFRLGLSFLSSLLPSPPALTPRSTQSDTSPPRCRKAPSRARRTPPSGSLAPRCTDSPSPPRLPT